ncbi:phospholipid carrier-dependent glycosyltransferase [Prochlorococcus marinus XMU1414]|nr:glycosyltransferase family 39 protein [Prochlorococcus marinus]MBO8228653.1 phospholipid carrier-dependent glycosyltransferase [Prochlorococcus marinus XMU1414]MCR8531576.1 glycosyltransferase family 39 protein [Prochlorococcus marinus XMU1420]MCR8535305.1 glycosyltransferase family 39 protein [Prochlorococcus marinus XMU1424]
MYNIFGDQGINIPEKFNQLLNVTDSYRGPLTYFLSALFLKLFNNTYKFAYLSNQIFNTICIISIFHLGKLLKNKSTGIWAALLFTFSSLILSQRTDYLIDLSLTSFSTLGFLFFTKWYLDKKKFSFYSPLAGASLGLIFLTRPTGVVIFFLSFLLIILKSIKSKFSFGYTLRELIFFFASFIIVIFPWFSKSWLTIITSTINAWNWGVNFQDGLEFYSIESWLYYLKRLPSMFGSINFSILSTIFLIEKTFQKNLLTFKIKSLKKVDLWFLIYIINCYLIISLMSTKDIRFFMPIFPILCIYLSRLLDSKNYKFFSSKSKKLIMILSIICTLLFSKNELFSKNLNNYSAYEWPHNDILNEIKKENKNLVSTLAILPDTKEINTFNLEAEASRQGEYVAVRQIISSKETYKDDLEFFDWFLIKTGSQGIMSNEAKNLLNQYLLNSPSFKIHKEWILPDQSKVSLLRRELLNSYLQKQDCKNSSLNIDIKKIPEGIRLNLMGKGNLIKSSSLLIDFFNEDIKNSTDISLANGSFHRNFDEKNCYFLIQDIPITFHENIKKEMDIKARILNKKGKIKNLKLFDNKIMIKNKSDEKSFIRMTNKIEKVDLLGDYLRRGEFEKLFNLVGVINQSDPKQIYLKDAEKIYLQRYIDNKDIKNLYNVLITQILQRKVYTAEKTINSILSSDFSNGNTQLAKAIINIYLLDKKNARISLNNSKKFDKSEESEEILNIVEGLTNLLELKIINAYRALT